MFESYVPLFVAVPLLLFTIIFIFMDFIKGVDYDKLDRTIVNKRKRQRLMILLFSCTAILILLIAIANPYVSFFHKTGNKNKIKVLIDNSSSMSLYEPFDMGKITGIGNKDLEVITLAENNRSSIYETMMGSVAEGDHILLVSDGNDNSGTDYSSSDLASFMKIKDAKVSIVDLNPVSDEHSIAISGPKYVVDGVSNDFEFIIDKNHGKDVTVDVIIDGNVVEKRTTGVGSFVISRSFTGTNHEIVARIKEADTFPDNNVFYKSIKVIDKTKLLYVGDKGSPIMGLLSANYDFVVDPDPSELFTETDVVLIDNKELSGLSEDFSDNLASFVRDGGGVVVLGGNKAFDYDHDYQESRISDILPVNKGTGTADNDDNYNVVIIIDLSPGTGDWKYEDSMDFNFSDHDADNRKGLALTMINRINPEYRASIIGVDINTRELSPLSKIANKDMAELRETIANAGPDSGPVGHSSLYLAVQEAKEVLLENGGGTIIMISDYDVEKDPWKFFKRKSIFEMTKESLMSVKQEGIAVHLIGIGKDEELEIGKYQTNEPNALAFAIAGGGKYHPLSEYQSVAFEFRKNPYQNDKDGEDNYLEIASMDHFITDGVTPKTIKISGYNQVVPKKSGIVLLSTTSDVPVLVISQYGLGRAATLATDNGIRWASQLYNDNNSKVLLRTINFAAGNTELNRENYVDIKDGSVDQTVFIDVKTDSLPKHDAITFLEQSEGMFSGRIVPDRIGFDKVLGEPFAVNYHKEFEKISVNGALLDLVSYTGGKIYKPEDFGLIVQEVLSPEDTTTQEKKHVTVIIVLIALGLYSLGAYIRRLIINLGY